MRYKYTYTNDSEETISFTFSSDETNIDELKEIGRQKARKLTSVIFADSIQNI